MDLGLKGLRAFVAGASTGLGYAAALGLGHEGVQLAINGRDQDNLRDSAERIAKETGATVHTLPGDLLDRAVPAQLIARAVDQMGGLDLLVTNSGGPPLGAFEDFDDAAWDKALDLVFGSHRRLIQAALPQLRNSKAASVLTITSISVKQPIPNLVLSNAARAATVGLTKTLALEFGAEGIRFNSILPAFTETERVVHIFEQRAKNKGTSVEEEKAAQAKESPLGRMAAPEEFANAAVFLLSPAASYITGVSLTVDGGSYKGAI